MPRNCLCVRISLLLAARLLFLARAQENPYTLGDTVPLNGTVLEVNMGGTATFVCRFIPQSESVEPTPTIRWFFKGAEINFSGSPLQFPGILFSVIHSQTSVESTLTLRIDNTTILHDGRITCYPPGNDSTGDFALFRTVLASRTVTIRWNSSKVSVDEDEGNVTVCATAHGWTAMESTLTVPILTLNSTATVGEDYAGVPDDLKFTEPSVCIDITIFDDRVHETDERISLEMVPPRRPSSEIGEVNIVTSTGAEVVIVEDDDTSVGISLFRHKLPESSGNTTVCVEVLEETECPIGFILDVILHVTDNTTSGASTIPEPVFLRFLPCQTVHCVDIPIDDDSIAESGERLILSLEIANSPSSGITPREKERVITIIDDDVFPELAVYFVPENGRSVEVCFIGRSDTLPQPVTFTLSTNSSGSATAGEDYEALDSAPLTLASDSARGCVEVAILPDDFLEDTEDFTVGLYSSAGILTPPVTIFIVDTTVCMTGELRLVDGPTNSSGRLEVCYNGEWGTVCDDLFYDIEASVACRQLGYEKGSLAIYSRFPDGDLPTLMDDVSCTGNETRLIDCAHKTREGSNCDRSEHVGLICGDLCINGEVRLTTFDDVEFFVGICHEGEYLDVCGDQWDAYDATIACRLAGFDQYSVAIPQSGFKTDSHSKVTNITCLGTERDFSSCDYDISVREVCHFAAVRCNATSPCGRGTFWCPEGSSDEPLCIARDGVCNGSTECPESNADEGACTVVNFTQESYTVGEADETLNVCVRVSFPESPLFLTGPSFTVDLHTLYDDDRDPTRVVLSFDPENSTQCALIEILDDDAVAISKISFVLALDSDEDEGLFIDRRLSHSVAYVEILDDEACDASAQFLCRSRLECLSLSLMCDGRVDCNDTSHTDESNCVSFCSAETADGLSWPGTKSGHGVELACPGNSTRRASRECRDGQWVEIGTCLTFRELPDISTEENVTEFLNELRLVVGGASEEEKNEENAQVIARALMTAAGRIRKNQLSPEQMTAVLSDIIAILDGLLGWGPEAVRAHGSQNVEAFETILVNLITSQTFTEPLSVTEDDIALLARPVAAEMYGENPLPFTISSIDAVPSIVNGSRRKSDQIATVTFPTSIFNSKQVVKGSGPLAVAVVVYEVPLFFPPPDNRRGSETSVGTPVVSMLVAKDGQQLEFEELNPPVEVTLAVTQVNIENVTNPRCVFWDFTHDEWSTEGCRTQFSVGEGHITCSCTHLTNFAALVDVCRRVEGCETSEEADYALSILSIIGVCLSLMGLSVTIFTMFFFKTLRKRDASKFHVQLCLAMLAMLLVFVAGVQQTEVKAACVTVSVLIHYFTLASVMWMGAEAVLMFQKLVIVFVQITTRHIVIISLICWLAPILPVIIPVAINPDYVIFESEDSSAGFCFISNTVAFFAAFLAPIMVIILFNCVVFVIIVVVLLRHKQRSKLTGLKMSKSKERRSTIRLMVSIAGIMSLYGLTWLFGALTVDKASLAFQVIFVVLNSLQGFFLFLFFCVLGRDGRELWLEFLFCGRYKSSYLHPSSVTTSSAEKKANNLMLVSDNTSSTTAPVLEKSITSEAGGGKYVVNYVEFSDKGKEKELSVTTDIDDRLTPEPTAVTFKDVGATETHANGTRHPHTAGNGHLVEYDGESAQQTGATNGESAVDNRKDEAVGGGDDEDEERSESSADLEKGMYHIETVDNHLSIAHV